MQTYYKDKFVELYHGDCLEVLKALPSESVQMCVTSPPYFGLRDYGIEGQMGLEETPEEYVSKLVNVFHEVKRILKNDGILWVNLGDSYYNYRPGGISQPKQTLAKSDGAVCLSTPKRNKVFSGIKEKDLMGIPWMVAFALRNDGWYLRQDIIWSKPNPMPESVQDRCTKSHEYIFLLSKSKSYYYDKEAVQEKAICAFDNRGERADSRRGTECNSINSNTGEFKNKRSVWNINTKPYKEAHFATFPLEIPEICIKAGSKEDDIVLDPFNGAGTTGVACTKWKRNYIGIDLNSEYLDISKKRLEQSIDRYSTPLLDLIDENKTQSEE